MSANGTRVFEIADLRRRGFSSALSLFRRVGCEYLARVELPKVSTSPVGTDVLRKKHSERANQANRRRDGCGVFISTFAHLSQSKRCHNGLRMFEKRNNQSDDAGAFVVGATDHRRGRNRSVFRSWVTPCRTSTRELGQLRARRHRYGGRNDSRIKPRVCTCTAQ